MKLNFGEKRYGGSPCSKTGRLPMKLGTDCVGVYAGAL